MSSEDFFEKTLHRDFPLVVEGREIFVNRGFLAELSPAFKKLFFGDFKEALPDVMEVALPDKKLGDILELMKAVFWRGPWQQNQPISQENVDVIVKLADEYEIDSLLKDCINFLEGNASMALWASLCFKYPHCLADTWPTLLSKINKVGNMVALVKVAEENGGNGAELKQKCLQWLDQEIDSCSLSNAPIPQLELLVICNKLRPHDRMVALVPKIARWASVEHIQEFYSQLDAGVIAAILEAKVIAYAPSTVQASRFNCTKFSESLLQK